VSAFFSATIPKSPREAISHPKWQQTMYDEVTILNSIHIWTLVPPPPGKSIVGCCWIDTFNAGPYRKIGMLKARLVAKARLRYLALITATLSLM
jgi:hypothetical protein